MPEEVRIQESEETKNTGLLRYAGECGAEPGIFPETVEDMPKDPEGIARMIQGELKHIKEHRGKVLAGKLLKNIRTIMYTLDTTINGADKDTICQHVVMSLQDTDIEVLSWVLTQGISGPYADALSAHIVERAERSQDPTPQTGQSEHAAGDAPEAAATSRVSESPHKKQEILNKEEPRPAEMGEKERRLAHF